MQEQLQKQKEQRFDPLKFTFLQNAFFLLTLGVLCIVIGVIGSQNFTGILQNVFIDDNNDKNYVVF